MFRKSPIKNAVLQKHIEAVFKKQLSLVLDCKTRWNSIEAMLDRFVLVHGPVKAALVELNYQAFADKIDKFMPTLKDLLQSLQPVKMAVESLSGSNNNLLASEGKANILSSYSLLHIKKYLH